VRPKVLFLDHTGALGGAELCLLDIALYYCESSRVVLFSDGPFCERLERQGVRVELLPAPNTMMDITREGSAAQDLLTTLQILKLAYRVAKIAQEHDLIYANSPKALVIGVLAGKASGKPVVWHLHDILSQHSFSLIHRRVAVAFANPLTKRVIANSRASAEAFIESGGRRELIHTVYNGIDPTPFDAVTEPGVCAMREALSLTAVPVVGSFGRLAPWKGQHILLDALPALPAVHALLVGEALFGEYAYVKSLREQADILGVADRVHVLGFRQDIPLLMRLSDVVVHTSIEPEPFGRVVIEGMMARKPVVATRGGRVVEIIEDKVNGILVPPRNSKALTETGITSVSWTGSV
jgi:glycosyltransferase involved in cell wall biosynthesis